MQKEVGRVLASMRTPFFSYALSWPMKGVLVETWTILKDIFMASVHSGLGFRARASAKCRFGQEEGGDSPKSKESVLLVQ